MKNILKVLTDESSKGYKRKKPQTKRSKFMYKYSQLRRFYHDGQLQVYMYAFMYVDPDTMLEEENFPDTKKCCELKENVKSRTSPKKLSWF